MQEQALEEPVLLFRWEVHGLHLSHQGCPVVTWAALGSPFYLTGTEQELTLPLLGALPSCPLSCHWATSEGICIQIILVPPPHRGQRNWKSNRKRP